MSVLPLEKDMFVAPVHSVFVLSEFVCSDVGTTLLAQRVATRLIPTRSCWLKDCVV